MPFNAHTLADAASAGAAALALALEEAGAGRKPEDVVNRCVWEWRFLGSFGVRAGRSVGRALAAPPSPLSPARFRPPGTCIAASAADPPSGNAGVGGASRGDVAVSVCVFYSKRRQGRSTSRTGSNAALPPPHSLDAAGVAPLHIAAYRGDADAVAALLAAGASAELGDAESGW